MSVEVFFVCVALGILFYLVVEAMYWLMRGLARAWREFWRDRSDECRRKN